MPVDGTSFQPARLLRARPETVTHKSRLPRDPKVPLRITVVGAGGNGSQVLPCLARLDRACRSLGLAPLDVSLFDPDRVSQSNVARQLFYPADVSQSKAVVLVNRLNTAFGLAWRAITSAYPPKADWTGHRIRLDQRLGSAGDAKFRDGCDVLITCIDSGVGRMMISDACLEMDEPPLYWLDLGNEDKTGQVWLGQFPRPGYKDGPWRLRTVVEEMPEFYDGSRPESSLPSCSLAEALQSQDLFINDHVSRWGVTLLWKLLRAREIEHRGYWINLKDGTVRPEPIYAPM